jgi:glycosyltransferase involved in cell wall biosynthesis
MRVLMISKALMVGAYHRKLEELAGLGIDLHVVIPDRWGTQSPEVTEGKGYVLRRVVAVFSGKNHFHFYPGLGKIVRLTKPDLVHIDEESYSFVTFQAMIIARRLSVPAIFFNWQNIHKRYPWPFSAFERFNISHAAAAIAGNADAKDVLVRKGCSIPLYIIPQFGVDPDDFRKIDATNVKIALFGNANVRVVGYGGRLVEEKGVLLLVEAFPHLSKSARLLFIGEGPMKNLILKRAVELGVADRVCLLDRISSTEMPRYLSCLDCLVLPSFTCPNWKEQFGRILTEAMACGVPVIGSDSGEIPRVIGHAGIVFPEGNVGLLAAALDRVLRQPTLRQRLAGLGRRRVLQHFTQREIARKTIEVYRSILGNAP